jgi:SAM-dependent methyltransferase
MVCQKCWLVQTEDFAEAEEFFSGDYAYFSSFSPSWLKHSADFARERIEGLGLDASSLVVEVASNDGYLLQYFQDAGVPCLGVEPTASTANAARSKGIRVVEEFFGLELGRRIAAEHGAADLTAANNVLAHVPDINDFVSGFAALLKPEGVATFEFPHLLELVKHAQFDTIYHEHFSYLSLTAVCGVMNANGLDVFDVERISTHGGSLRVHAQRSDIRARSRSESVDQVSRMEESHGVRDPSWYSTLQLEAERIRADLLEFLGECRRSKKKVVGYGAAAKGNTLLNFAGVDSDLLEYVVDRNPAKQGRYLPGSRIPIHDPDVIRRDRPDYVLVLPWNLIGEIKTQLAEIRDWGGAFVTAVPSLKVQ